MNNYTVICIEKGKTMQDVDAKFLDLGCFHSIDGLDIEDKLVFNKDAWRVCVIAKNN